MCSAVRIVFEVICSVGFSIFDLIYVAILVNYGFQCQLLIYHIWSIKDKVIVREWPGIVEAHAMSQFTVEPVLERAMKVTLDTS